MISNLKLKKPLIFFDIETTGTDVKRDRIIELYAKKFNPDGSIEEYYELFNPCMMISESATDVHGFTNESLEGEKKFGECSEEIFNFFNNCDYGGYNCIRFDIPFLMEELNRNGFRFAPIKSNFIDPYRIITKLESNKLEDVYERYFGEKLINKHQAKSDIYATIRIFEEQMKKYDLKDVSDISDISRSDSKGNEFIDFVGMFYKNDNKYYYGIGKFKDKLVSDNLSYLDWIINKSDMQKNVKIVAS